MKTHDRRTFLEVAAASLLPIGVSAQTSGPRVVAERARHSLTGALDGFDAVLVELNLPAGGGPGAAHRHPGPVLGYVVEGQMRFGVNHEPDQIVPTGGTFFEAAGVVHSTTASAKSDAPARVLAFMVVPKGSALTTPA